MFRRLGLRLGVTTNGLPLGSAAVREMLADYEQVTVSVDGVAGFHDHLRDSPGLFERVRENVRLLRSEIGSSPLLRVNTVLMRGNIGSFNIVLGDRPDLGHVLKLERATDRFFVERRIVQSACDAGKLLHASHSDRRSIEKCARHGRHKITRCARQNLPAAPAPHRKSAVENNESKILVLAEGTIRDRPLSSALSRFPNVGLDQ